MEAGRSVAYDGVIYFAAYQSTQIWCYSVCKMDWRNYGSPMSYCNPGLAIIGGFVAAIGGHEMGRPTNNVLAWKGSRWKKYQKMIKKRSDPATVTSTDGKYVIVCGGNLYIDYAVHWTDAVEVYDVEKDEWKAVGKFPYALSYRTRLEATLCNDAVYVFTGQNQNGSKCSLNALISPTVDWKPIKGLPKNFSTPATLKNTVVCVGGADAQGCGITDVYMYHDDRDSWEKIGSVQGEGRMYCMVEVFENKCIIVGGISEIADVRESSKCLKRMDFFTKTQKTKST